MHFKIGDKIRLNEKGKKIFHDAISINCNGIFIIREIRDSIIKIKDWNGHFYKEEITKVPDLPIKVVRKKTYG